MTMKLLREFESFDVKLIHKLKADIESRFNASNVVCHSPGLHQRSRNMGIEAFNATESLSRLKPGYDQIDLPDELFLVIDLSSVFLEDVAKVFSFYQIVNVYVPKVGIAAHDLQVKIQNKKWGIFDYFRKPEFHKLVQGECFIFPEHHYYVLKSESA